MKDCGIVKDLLPLYAEDMASEESAAFVKEHLETCGDCRKAYEEMKTPVEAEPAAPLKTVKKAVKKRGLLIAGLIACLVAALLVGVFARITKPIPIGPEEAFESISVEGDHIKLTIREGVTVRSTISGNNDFIDIYAYQTPFLDTWFDGARNTVRLTEQSIDMDMSGNDIKAVFFQSFDGTDETALYLREGYTPESGFALPRLVVNYYFAFALIAAVILFIPWLVLLLTKRQKASRVFGVLLIIAGSGVLAFLFAGFPATTIEPLRDLIFVCVIALLLIGAGLCGRKLLRKE